MHKTGKHQRAGEKLLLQKGRRVISPGWRSEKYIINFGRISMRERSAISLRTFTTSIFSVNPFMSWTFMKNRMPRRSPSFQLVGRIYYETFKPSHHPLINRHYIGWQIPQTSKSSLLSEPALTKGAAKIYLGVQFQRANHDRQCKNDYRYSSSPL